MHTTKMIAVDVTLGQSYSAGAPRMVFEGSYSRGILHQQGDVTADGQRFVMMQNMPPPVVPPLTHMILVQNWGDELRQRVPARR